MVKDLKESLGSARKADLTQVRRSFMVYTARPCEYGNDKYERANFLRPAPQPKLERQRGEKLAADFLRLREYTRAAMSHLAAMLDAMELHEANDPNLVDVDGMKAAAFAPDTDETTGAKVGASMLPHIAHACASLNMAITQATTYGLLPEDPGVTWSKREQPAEPKRYDPNDITIVINGDPFEHCAIIGWDPGLSNIEGARAWVLPVEEALGKGRAILPRTERDGFITIHPKVPTARVEVLGTGQPLSLQRKPIELQPAFSDLRAEIAAAGLPPAPEEAMTGRKLVRGRRDDGWVGRNQPSLGATAPSPDVWACDGRPGALDWQPGWRGILGDVWYLVPVEWT